MSRLALWALLAAPACVPPYGEPTGELQGEGEQSQGEGEESLGGQSGEDNGSECGDATTIPVGLHDPTPAGTAAKLLALVGGTHAYPLTWRDGAVATLTLTVQGVGAGAELVTFEAPGCGEVLEVPVALTFATSDDLLDESCDGLLEARAEGEVAVGCGVPAAELEGAWVPDAPQSEHTLHLRARFVPVEDGLVYVLDADLDPTVIATW